MRIDFRNLRRQSQYLFETDRLNYVDIELENNSPI